LKLATLDNTALTQQLWVITTTVLVTRRERMAATVCAKLFQDGNALISSIKCFEEKLGLKNHSLGQNAGRLRIQQKVHTDVGFSLKISTISVDTYTIRHRGTIISCFLLTIMNFKKIL
jgi:hypothetical protein